MNSYNAVDRAFFKNEVLLAKSCLDAGDAVLSNDKKTLQDYKQKFAVAEGIDASSSAPQSSAAGADGAGRKEHTIGSAAPIEYVQDLPFIPDIRIQAPEVFHTLTELQANDDFRDMKWKCTNEPPGGQIAGMEIQCLQHVI